MITLTHRLIAPPVVLGESFGAYFARLAEGDYAFSRLISTRLVARYGPVLPSATAMMRAERARIFEVHLLRCLFQDRSVRAIFGPEIQEASRHLQHAARSTFSGRV